MESSYKSDEPKTIESQQYPLNTISGGSLKTNDQPWQEWIDIGMEFISKIPDQLGSFFSGYKQPLVTLLLILSSIVSVYITLAVLDAIDDIPLLAPVLELVGLAYTGWFVYRYLLKASTRSELLQEFEALKSQVLGRNSQES